MIYAYTPPSPPHLSRTQRPRPSPARLRLFSHVVKRLVTIPALAVVALARALAPPVVCTCTQGHGQGQHTWKQGQGQGQGGFPFMLHPRHTRVREAGEKTIGKTGNMQQEIGNPHLVESKGYRTQTGRPHMHSPARTHNSL